MDRYGEESETIGVGRFGSIEAAALDLLNVYWGLRIFVHERVWEWKDERMGISSWLGTLVRDARREDISPERAPWPKRRLAYCVSLTADDEDCGAVDRQRSCQSVVTSR